MNINDAFSKQFIGVSFWEIGEGRIQCSLKRRDGGAFCVGVGDTIEEAWDVAWNGIPKPKPRRVVDDLI